MAYDFTLMRFPRPTQPGLEAPDPGPLPIQRGQIRQVMAGQAGLRPGAGPDTWQMEAPEGPHIEIHLDPRDPPEFVAVEFDRYASQADYTAARAVVDRLCEVLRLTITDDPDAGADLGRPVETGGFMDKLRGLFGR
jgi:hypothetical protein